MRVIETKVFPFKELSDDAKERARDWYRQASADDSFWSDSVIEDAANIADLMGLDVRQRVAKLMNGKTRMEPAIYFSGFSSQGDGASFDGTWTHKADCVAAVKDYAPKDAELHAIAQALADTVPEGATYTLSATIKQRGNYVHEMTMNVEVERQDTGDAENDAVTEDEETAVTEALRDFARWIYASLEREYDYQNDDAQVDEALIAGEYEFDEDGNYH